MAKTSKSWLPKRSSSSGRFVTEQNGKSANLDLKADRTSVIESGHYRSSVSGRFELPNGQSIKTVRKDVMDRALGRGDFKKK